MPPPPASPWPLLQLRRVCRLSLDRPASLPVDTRACLFARPQTAKTACFSTSPARWANPSPKKKGLVAAPKRGTRTLNVKRGKRASGQSTARPPAVGERKAQRKRVVLSNNNALPVPGLVDLDKSNALSDDIRGHVMGIPDLAVDALRAVDAFKPTQGWRLFRRPATLIRTETARLAGLVRDVQAPAEGQARATVRRILTGDRLSGKSTLLLQGLAVAWLQGWVVVNLPEAKDLVNGHTDYAPLPGSRPAQYTQDTYTASLLSQMVAANSALFAATRVVTKPTLPVPLPATATLKQLAELGIASPEASWPVFVALWAELTHPGRPPVMLTLDGLSHIMRESDYLSADVKPIHSHDLTLVRHFVDHLSGKVPLPNGGIVLAATSTSNAPSSPALDFSVLLAKARARNAHPSHTPTWNPYRVVDQRAMECLANVDTLNVSGLSKEEARTIMEYYAQSGLLRAKVDEKLVAEKWSLAGMGNVGELERTSIRLV
ncbi:hypothetical protein K491DRAFT_697972 [Lophiostoma macrostomum CBS 122681]|uniref:Small ribosomal subunit protein mS29 n=1 Tax=Lophiostoma macrostomum CBS 122681 TaxID=1314788 RepID=A0A6A6SRI9_9PLEO|nr:hypothetical protein K491DRAFT_697972 [Lophiostoma macrostomum CBS 122681]